MQAPSWIQEVVVKALGWTFVHSLWQGLLLAILAGGVVLLTRRARAGLRYNLLVMLAGLFVAGAVVTFAWQWRQSAAAFKTAPPVTVMAGVQPVNNLLLPVFYDNVQATPRRFVDRFVDYFNTHASLIVLVWFVVFSARLVRLLANLLYVQRIRHHKTYATPVHWKERVEALAAGLGLRRPVQLLQSGIVQVPLVVGVLKPVILVPLGILSQLPPSQVEAILLHELAHIRRRDYLVNLLQSIAETVFFFNPAVWWVSSLIRDERENCCDDIAVAGARSKAAFLDALVSFQEYRSGVAAYGMAFPGRQHHLLNRVKRILHEKNKTLNTMEKSLLTFSIAIILLLCLTDARQVQAQTDKKAPPTPAAAATAPGAPAPAPAAPAPAAPSATPRVIALPPHAPAPATGASPQAPATAPASPGAAAPSAPTTTADIAVREAMSPSAPFAYAPARVLSAPLPPVGSALPTAVADTSVPVPAGFKNVSSSINDDGKTKTEHLDATDRDGKTYSISKLNNVVTSLSIDGVEVPKEKYGDYQPLIERLDAARDANWEKSRQKQLRMQELKLKNQEYHLQQQQAMESKKWAMQRKQIVPDREMALKKYDLVWKKGNAAQGYKPAPCDPVKVEVTVSPAGPRRKVALFSGEKTELFSRRMPDKGIGPVSPVGPRGKKARVFDADDIERQKDILRRMADDLVADGIIKSKKRLESLGLTDTELIVNGRKLADDVQQKYRDKYIAHPGLGLFYGPVHMTGKGYFVDKEDL